MLKTAIEHIAKLNVPRNCIIELVISDNNPDKDAYSVFLEYKEQIPFMIHYCHEPQKSIAAVRNAVLQKALEINADYIAFIDDDEYPLPDWIAELYKTMVDFNADGATSFPQQIIDEKKCDIPFNIKRRADGSLRKTCITNSVIFKTSIIKDYNLMFDTDFGLMTGEDIDFFSRAVNKGCKFVWCNKILLYDIITKDRTTLEWRIDRAINNGYLKIFTAKKSDKNIKKKYYKTLLDLSIFSFLSILCYFLSQRYKDKCLMKLMDCFGKIRSIFSDKAYTHYKRE